MISSTIGLMTGAALGVLACVPGTARGQAVTGGAVAPSAAPVAQPPRAPARTPLRVMSLRASFPDGGMIPARHAQTGRDVSPALSWRGAPDSVRSYVLLVHDADAALADGIDDTLHWLVWNIPGTATALPEGVGSGAQQVNGMRQISVSGPYYRGPAAPPTGPAHHYLFELYALDTMLSVPATGMSPAATREAVVRAMAGHVRAKGVLVGLYQRPTP